MPKASKSTKTSKKNEWPTITVTKKTNELLQKIHAHVNKDKKPEEHMIEFDVLDNALRCYADKLGVQSSED